MYIDHFKTMSIFALLFCWQRTLFLRCFYFELFLKRKKDVLGNFGEGSTNYLFFLFLCIKTKTKQQQIVTSTLHLLILNQLHQTVCQSTSQMFSSFQFRGSRPTKWWQRWLLWLFFFPSPEIKGFFFLYCAVVLSEQNDNRYICVCMAVPDRNVGCKWLIEQLAANGW